MDMKDISMGGLVGGIVAIVLEFLVGWISPGAAYGFGFVAMLVGGFVAGWMAMGKKPDMAIGAGIVAGLIYVVFGLFIIFPVISKYHVTSYIVSLVIGIILGAVGGFAGQLLNSGNSSKSMGKKR